MRVHYGQGPRMHDRPAPAASEEELFHGHRGLLTTVDCACGSTVSAMPTDALLVRLAVDNHQRTAVHRGWWKAVEKLWH